MHIALEIRGWLPGSTAGSLETATKGSIVHNANPGIAPPPCAWSIEMGRMLGRTHATTGCAAVAVARSGGRALKQESAASPGRVQFR